MKIWNPLVKYTLDILKPQLISVTKGQIPIFIFIYFLFHFFLAASAEMIENISSKRTKLRVIPAFTCQSFLEAVSVFYNSEDQHFISFQI